MIIKTNTKEIAASAAIGTTLSKGGKSYPALKLILTHGVSDADIAALTDGEFQIVDESGSAGSTYTGYTTLKEISVTIGKITTEDQQIEELTTALAAEEAKKPLIEKAILALDDAEASTVAALYPTLKGDGKLIRGGTRINWDGKLKRAAVDLWDTPENTPDAEPALWEDVDYVNGYREIGEYITASHPFSEGEEGIDADGVIWISKYDNNVYTPTQYPDNWTKKEGTS